MKQRTSIDFLELFGPERSALQQLFRDKICNCAKKVQLTTELKLLKPKFDQTSQETFTIHTNSDCVLVYIFGLSDDDFCRLIEQLTGSVQLCIAW